MKGKDGLHSSPEETYEPVAFLDVEEGDYLSGTYTRNRTPRPFKGEVIGVSKIGSTEIIRIGGHGPIYIDDTPMSLSRRS